MMNASVLDSLKKSAAVPSMPQVVLRFLQIMQDPDFEYDHLVRALSADPGTVGELLRLSNSALFGVRNKVVSPKQALTLLGPKRTRSLLLGRYLVDSMAKPRTTGLDMTYFWRRSLSGSVVASRFAQKLIPRAQDEAFIGALLADIGIPILLEAFPEAYGPVAAEYSPNGKGICCDDELAAVEVTHAQVAAMVLTHWTVPESVTHAVNLQHSASPGSGDVATVARILNAADRIAAMLCGTPSTESVFQTCTAALEFVGMNESVLLQILPSIEEDIQEMADALRITIMPGQGCKSVAAALSEHAAVTA
jgi:HD-like signal output (HDOD) protein